MLGKQQIPSAAIIIIAASFSFCCETRETEFQAGFNNQSGQRYDSHRKQNDAAFIIEASNDVTLEAQLAQLAVKNAVTPEVKALAISVLTDHTIAMSEIQEIASKNNIVLPNAIPSSHRQHYLRLAKKNNVQFDRAYCDFMYVNNTIVLKRFEKIAQEANNEELKDWAWGKLGILRRQIALAQDIEHARLEASIEAGVTVK